MTQCLASTTFFSIHVSNASKSKLILSDHLCHADPGAPSSQSNFVSHIQFVEITLSTQNFHPDTLLGEGRFGPLYKGWIHEHFLTAVKPGSGIAVAIRKLNRVGFKGHTVLCCCA